VPRLDVSILVVSYNTRDLTHAAIAAAKAETRDVRCEIIVVDNASSDGSAEMLRTHDAKPKVIALDQNIGFARANNLAAKQARGRYILLLNPDTLVLGRAIDRLVMFAERNPKARIWGGRTLFPDMRLNPTSCWRRMTIWNQFCRASGLAAVFKNSELFNSEGFGGWAHDSVRRVDIVSGCFLLIERRFWEDLGGFDPQFFMYGEEADLCLRARRHGAMPLVTPTATIVHLSGASERVRSDKMVRLLAAKSLLISRHWPRMSQPVGRLLLAMWPSSRMLATSVIARFAIDPRAAETADTWRTIWRRRAEWLHGYEPLAVGAPTEPANPDPAAAVTP
jgi:GT2 family glycosyltransferase